MLVGAYQNHPEFGETQANVEIAVRDLSNVKANLVVLPELFNTGYQFVSRQEVETLAEEIFFLCLFVAGLSSSISITEAFTSAIIDKFGIERKTAVTPVCIIGFAGSIIFSTQAGIHWLDILDHFLTHYGLVVIGVFECILVGWLFRLEVLRKHINKISSVKLGIWWDVLIKYFIPIVLGIILIGDLFGEFKKPYGGYSWTSIILIGRDWLLLTLIAGFWIALRPWKTAQNTKHGRNDVRGT